LPHLQQLPDKNARAGGEPRPRLENACGYPLTAAR
ncbi:type IV secretion protein Rhs, partial [Escherichia coli]